MVISVVTAASVRTVFIACYALGRKANYAQAQAVDRRPAPTTTNRPLLDRSSSRVRPTAGATLARERDPLVSNLPERKIRSSPRHRRFASSYPEAADAR